MAKYEAALQADGSQQCTSGSQAPSGTPRTSDFTLHAILKRSGVAGPGEDSGDLQDDVRSKFRKDPDMFVPG